MTVSTPISLHSKENVDGGAVFLFPICIGIFDNIISSFLMYILQNSCPAPYAPNM
jgi:hypothetical protein